MGPAVYFPVPLFPFGVAVAGSSATASDGSTAGVSTELIIVLACMGVLVVVLIMGTTWVVYAYRNPNTPSGRGLMEHRHCKSMFASDET